MGWREDTLCVHHGEPAQRHALHRRHQRPLRRVGEHKQDLNEGFTKKYGVHRLVYYELHVTMDAAITREKRIKEWQRAWKIRLIESMNPEWIDLFDSAQARSSMARLIWRGHPLGPRAAD